MPSSARGPLMKVASDWRMCGRGSIKNSARLVPTWNAWKRLYICASWVVCDASSRRSTLSSVMRTLLV